MPTLNFKSDFIPNPNPSIKWSHFARCDRTLGSNPTTLETGIIFILDRKEQLHDEQLFHTLLPTMQNLNFNARFHPKPNPSMKWSNFARCRWSISPNPENLETGIVFSLFGRKQFHHTELVQTPFPTMLTLNFRSDFTSNPNPSIKWSHFARCRWSISLNPEDLETDRKEQLHDEQLFHTLLPTMQNLNFNARFHPNTNPSMKWSHFARCRCPNPNPPIEWSHFARCDRSLSLNPENLETGIVFNLFGREQFHHTELVQTPFPTMLTLNFKSDFTPNPNPSINRSHFARCDRTLGSNPTNLETGIVFILDRKEQLHDEQLFHTLLPTMQNLNFNARFHPNPNPSMKWSHFARCDRTLGSNPTNLETGIIFILDRKEQLHDEQLFHMPLPTMQNLNFNARFHPKPNPSMKWSHFARCRWSISPNPEDLETGIVFNLFGREQFHHTELVQTPFPTMLTLNFRSDFTSNPNPSIKWSHFARCRWSISLNPEDLETDRKEQLHDEQLFHTLLPTMQNLNFNARFHPNPNPSMKWSHFARCRWSISSNPEDLETGIVFNLFGREQFHHTELVQTPFPTMPTTNFQSDFTPNPNPSIKWSHFARCDRTLGSNPTNLETGIIFILDRKEQLHDEQLFHMPLPTMQNLNFNARFHPKPNPSMKWSHFARCRWSISPNPEDLETGIVFNLFGREQFHHTELVQTPFPTMLTLNFRSDFTSNPNPSIKWSHFARCRWSISLNPEDLETELVQTPFPTMPTLNFKSDFTPNPNPSIKWSHFARCDRTLGSNPTTLETGIIFILDRKEQLHDEQLFHTLLPTMQNLNFNARFHPKPNPSMKWSNFARCRWSISPNPENLETGIVFSLFGRKQFHHTELVQTPFPTMLTLNFRSDFTSNPNPSIKWSHFARCRWSISLNPEDLETGIVFNLLDRKQFHHTELVQTLFPTILTLNVKGAYTSNPSPSINRNHFSRCDRSLGSNPTNLETGIIFILDRKEQLHDEQLFHTLLPTMQNLNFNARFHPNTNPSMKWSHFARCRW
ncbi:unnamed protein product [Clavelina lepadiformis]|uniref:Uncharacterized protein n=1 Tax=Clavelina lepadiformis TaxID=159417 RepID=A0ABP0FIU3_CLALP